MNTKSRQPSPRVRERLYVWYETVDGLELLRAAEAALIWLRVHRQVVNQLNVFPVPDGDTGTNMLLTMQEAWKRIEGLEEPTISEAAHALAEGALMGARGNSGVILSQILRGFARGLGTRETADAAAIRDALREASEAAYRGVGRPVEGTMLTVCREIAEGAEAAVKDGVTSVLEVLERVVEAADQSVRRTPDLLPVLKQAGVVDSGGKGLYFLLEGMLRFAHGLGLDESDAGILPLEDLDLAAAEEVIEPGQDWEVIVDFRPQGALEYPRLYEQLGAMGTSIQVGEGEKLVRLHIHVPDGRQYEPIEFLSRLGVVTKVAIENLMDQMGSTAGGPIPPEFATPQPGQIAVVAVAPGPGFERVFASLGAAAVVRGGQSMNPSTNDILAAFADLATDKIVILPNNKNVQLAARQAADQSSKDVAVVPSVSAPQGIAAFLRHDPEGDFGEVVAGMTAALRSVRSLELTRATRSVEIDGVQVRKGDIIGVLDGQIRASLPDLVSALLQIVGSEEIGAAELFTLFSGEDLGQAEAEKLAEGIRELRPDADVEVVEGGQPHYPLIVSIE